MLEQTTATAPAPATSRAHLGRAALVYAQRLGWRVMPLHNARPDGTCSCEPRQDGKPCKSQGKHPRLAKWVAEASSDPDDIADWARQWPQANVGVATGSASGFFVLDVDTDKGGAESLAALIEAHGPLPTTPQAITGSGGAHFLFRMPGHPVTNNASTALGKGIDIRGDGGQIVVAPSVSAKGPYTWVHAPWDTPIAEAPAWLLERLRRAPAPRAPGAVTVDPTRRGYFPPASPAVLDQAREALELHGPAIDGEGGGLHTVHAAAILTHDFALTDEEAWPIFWEWNATCVPPWEEADLRVMLSRGRKYGKAEYGCRRPTDAVEAARKMISDWQAAGEAQPFGLLERVRQLRWDDPAKREVIQNELIAATGLKATAIGLPRAVHRPPAPPSASTDQGTWARYGFELGNNGSPIANIDNAVRVLEHERRPIFFEEFSQRIRAPAGEWSDAEDLALALDMQRRLGLSKMTPQIVSQAVIVYARRNARDAVREALERWTWDGTRRIAGFLAQAFGADDSPYTRAASVNFWRSLVARPLNPGCKVDTMLVLEGAQGIQKSTGLRVIAGDALFSEASESPHSKDFFLALQGKLLVEVAEMDAFSRSEVTAVKRVLSCQVDRFRAPYERATRDWPRRGIFVGTTNRSDWARDDTGARRFWPIRCTRVDLALIRATREQLFAEAVADVKAGATWWEMPAEATAAEQEARRQVHPWEEILASHLARLNASEQVTSVDLLRFAIGLEPARMDKAAQMQVASILKRLGYERVDGWRDGQKQKFWQRREGVGRAQGTDSSAPLPTFPPSHLAQ